MPRRDSGKPWDRVAVGVITWHPADGGTASPQSVYGHRATAFSDPNTVL